MCKLHQMPSARKTPYQRACSNKITNFHRQIWLRDNPSRLLARSAHNSHPRSASNPYTFLRQSKKSKQTINQSQNTQLDQNKNNTILSQNFLLFLFIKNFIQIAGISKIARNLEFVDFLAFLFVFFIGPRSSFRCIGRLALLHNRRKSQSSRISRDTDAANPSSRSQAQSRQRKRLRSQR